MMTKNENSQRTLDMLRYQAKRYQAMGNGAMSQQLNMKIRRLLETMDSAEVKN